ncbi:MULTISPECIES: ribose 5-phosphate isomerase B [Exiguobacterium]|jgi:ribose 5-phosphate isomerase B|uniref:Sugar-phosphate isomerase, RpiB/LacA/LacB family n=1 Tax=Exiguobacterium sp. (strain ATCC BAA-1283 / AT1b) TaxID=360911 RepID=C4KYU8_EXISA|nr:MULTISPECIES: ribose 5-phosphate isomerase B [Exiguobacterium]MCC9621823.1 ribose 5-phosphate isomerase B [Thalassospira sp. MA62]MDX5423810.1 ribose 5-phosphate isomerase B [Exiguobacterium sp.]ACQ70261.1 sugar-phosphate isomerase, RpiB/LacA/LacB family [Exiguobacterium sp. AT1b]MCM3280428.1 ribose 5-phosphate isomerase B [Exiguobacterium sp. MER 193]MCV9900344.1 ribose 5-phosphate isomerase B [Exiguobacterium sp. N5]
MKIAIGADHGGFNLKKEIVALLEELGHEYKDFGTHSADSIDYPDVAIPVAEAVAAGEFDRGILICGTGIGIGIAANKVKGIRAALVHDSFSAKATRQHNDSNIMTMGERVIGPGLALDLVTTWLDTDFEGGRHSNRVDKMSAYESK